MCKMFLALVMALAVEGCASTRPVLYPNAHFNAVGAEAAARDIASCMDLAESAGADAAGRDAGQAATRTAGSSDWACISPIFCTRSACPIARAA